MINGWAVGQGSWGVDGVDQGSEDGFGGNGLHTGEDFVLKVGVGVRGVAATEGGGGVVPEGGRQGRVADGKPRGRAGHGDDARDNRVMRPGEGVVVDRSAAGRLAEDGDARGVAAEGVDIVAYPLERQALIEKAEVLVPVRVAGEAEEAQAVAGR